MGGNPIDEEKFRKELKQKTPLLRGLYYFFFAAFLAAFFGAAFFAVAFLAVAFLAVAFFAMVFCF